ncbi:hypothetical protein DPMN_124079 [Dreissena polymorpha]|uniref:Uncharacterized protein n=1 Tax=Dreissena polymorpha TaxID=45954 RepID=A0A9D4JTI2_DREPO|nr:hypothetical protein DPMN_124079 [Dreissena polymorpha]
MQLRSGEVQIEWFCNGCRNVDEPPPPLEIPVSPLRNLAQEDLRHGGWHRRINARACSANLGLYKLANLLREESETVDLHIRLVSQHLLTKIRRKKYVTIHGRLHQAWDDYEEEKLTTTELLRIISHINALGPSTAVHHMLDDDEA